MAEMKTRETGASVEAFVAGVTPERRKCDSLTLLNLMRRVTGLEPKMWGARIVGFGRYHYVYESGREGDYLIIGFSPGKAALSVYVMPGFSGFQALMARLGKHKIGKSCLYINKLDDVDLAVLEELLGDAFAHMKRKYGV